MTKRLEGRIEDLERAELPPGKMVVVGLGHFDWTPEQLDAAVKVAEEEAGPNAVVFAVSYGTWPSWTN